MILSIQQRVHDAIDEAVRRQFGVAEVPPSPSRRRPTARSATSPSPSRFSSRGRSARRRAPSHRSSRRPSGRCRASSRIVATPNGYLNLYLERRVISPRRDWGRHPSCLASPQSKTIVEHTAINPNKAAHVGHLRNAALGDTLVRVLRFRGTPVEVQNYIDDTGVQVADVIVGFSELERQTLSGVKHIAETTRFDYYCWDLYSQRHRMVRRRQEPPRRSARRPCTISNTAATKSPRWARSSSIASCARISRRWRGSTSRTTC